MQTLVPPRHASRFRSSYVFVALIALVLLIAAAGTLPGVTRPAAGPLGLVDLELEEGFMKAGDVAFDEFVEMPAALPAADGFGDVMRAPSEADTDGRVDDALIVRTASLELEVKDVADVLMGARREISALGGYVSGSDEYDQGESRWALVTYRVPVERFGEAIDALRGLSARVVRESTQSSEVTATVVDLDARIANLRASEEALVEIMDRAGRMEDVLAVQSRLEGVRGQIEQLEAQRSHLADQAALSTITVSWFTPVAAVAVAREGWDLGREVDAALAQTVQALQAVASLGVWVAFVAAPLVGIPALALVLLGILLLRRSRRDPSGAPTGS